MFIFSVRRMSNTFSSSIANVCLPYFRNDTVLDLRIAGQDVALVRPQQALGILQHYQVALEVVLEEEAIHWIY